MEVAGFFGKVDKFWEKWLGFFKGGQILGEMYVEMAWVF